MSRERRICFFMSIMFTTGMAVLCFSVLQSPIAIALSLSLALLMGGLTPSIATYWEGKGTKKKQSYIGTIHRKAMEVAARADMLKPEQAKRTRRKLLMHAFNYEKEAALLARNNPSEPTLSVLHESAASLAVELGYYAEARNLITYALVQSPPHDIKEELEDLEKVIKCRISNSSSKTQQ